MPGSFTYSSFGAGACAAVGVAKLLLPSASECRGDEGWSSDRRANTLVMILGRNRELDNECGWDLVDAALPVSVKRSSLAGAVDGRVGVSNGLVETGAGEACLCDIERVSKLGRRSRISVGDDGWSLVERTS